jgi:hypothetical protein
MSEDYKSIADTLTAFAGTEEGKFFLQSNSTGGGATGSSPKTTNTNNPYKKESFNLTEQIKLENNDPAKAAALKAQAGV